MRTTLKIKKAVKRKVCCFVLPLVMTALLFTGFAGIKFGYNLALDKVCGDIRYYSDADAVKIRDCEGR